MAPRIHLGTQGWNYTAWLGPLYPTGTRPTDFLSVYARAFDTVEVDSTFYAIPPLRTFEGWKARTPAGFRFALKLPQEITHERGLRDSEDTLLMFCDRARALGEKLGPILIQMGPAFTSAELPALTRFLPLLPRDIAFAIEFRQRGWINDGVLALLADYDVVLALSDGRWIPRQKTMELVERPTGRFRYLRWMGPDRTIVDFSRVQVDRTRELEQWARVLGNLDDDREAWGYINNHFSGHSPESARQLQRLLGQHTVDPSMLGDQMSLF